MARIRLGPISLDAEDLDTVLEKTKGFITSRSPSQIVTLNSLMFNLALRNASLSEVISGSPLVIADSSGIIWASRFLSNTSLKRLPGIDVLERICAYAAGSGYGIYLLGGKPGVADAAAINLSKLYPGLKVIGARDGYFRPEEEDAVISAITAKRPDILFVGFDMPKQELWIAKNLSRLKVPVVMGVGGSFDVISGRLKRAPKFMRALHLEWFFRFMQQPWRFARMTDLPVFVLNILRLKMSFQSQH